mgnify:FL=1
MAQGDDKMDNLFADIRGQIVGSLQEDVSDEELEELIDEHIFQHTRDRYIGIGAKSELKKRLFDSMRRLDILQPLVDDKGITEIMVNGPNDIFIERNGRTERYDLTFDTVKGLEDVIQNIVSRVNRRVDESSPIVDARLQDGSRVNVVLPPIALNGPIMTIRKFPEKPMSIEQMIKYKSITPEVALFLEDLVKARYNIFVCGGTGSGKTTFLNALSNFIPRDERIVTIEDSAELQIVNVENLVRMETRDANIEGKAAITIRDLIKTSLRMRPDRVIVGEVRGAEALDMLQAMNTGHDGSLSTGHANSTRDMLSRLETMVLSGASIPLEAIRQQIASALDIIIHLSRLRDKTRRVIEITELVGYQNGNFILNPLFVFEETGEENGIIQGRLVRTANRFKQIEKLNFAGIEMDPQLIGGD